MIPLAPVIPWIKLNPLKAFKIGLWIVIALLIMALAWKLIDIGVKKCEGKQDKARIIQLENALELERAYLNRVLTAQASNQKFMTRQRKAVSNAKEADAYCAAVLCNTIHRLHNDTGHD